LPGEGAIVKIEGKKVAAYRIRQEYYILLTLPAGTWAALFPGIMQKKPGTVHVMALVIVQKER